MSTTVGIVERATPALVSFELAPSSGQVNSAIGRAVVKLMQDHFSTLPPNKRHFPGTGFWKPAAQATQFEALPGGVRISVNQTGVRQRFLGGPIEAVKAGYLTIPAVAEAYGHRATEFTNLKLFGGRSSSTGRGGPVGLKLATGASKANSTESDGVFYWLVQSVWQEPNPKILPTDIEMSATALPAANRALSTTLNNESTR
jgi:hypothetical protein